VLRLVRQTVRREEAIDVMKEIGSSCKLLNPREIDLEGSSLVGHYKIRIKSSVDDENWQCLKAIAKKYGLGIKINDETLIIYKAKEENGNRLVEL
jgi:hypothetical protein